MRCLIAAVVLTGFAGHAMAQLKSPDGRYEITYNSAGLYESNVEFKDTKSGKVIHYGSSTSYQMIKYHEVLWSQDSKYVALISRGTRTTTEFEVLRFKDGVVTEVKLPNYGAEIQKHKPSKRGGRYEWVSQLRWEGSKLSFRCVGQWEDGSGDPAVDPDNWYHFEVTIKVNEKSPQKAEMLGVAAVDEAVKIE